MVDPFAIFAVVGSFILSFVRLVTREGEWIKERDINPKDENPDKKSHNTTNVNTQETKVSVNSTNIVKSKNVNNIFASDNKNNEEENNINTIVGFIFFVILFVIIIVLIVISVKSFKKARQRNRINYYRIEGKPPVSSPVNSSRGSLKVNRKNDSSKKSKKDELSKMV